MLKYPELTPHSVLDDLVLLLAVDLLADDASDADKVLA